MNLIKNQFAAFFFKEISGLNYAYLNYPVSGALDQPAGGIAELILDKDDYAALLYVITSFPHIAAIRTKKEYKAQHVQLQFADQSSFSIKLMLAVMRRGSVMIDAAEVLATAETNAEGVREASHGFRFEYLMLQSMFARQNMPAAYCQSLNSLEPSQRSSVFGHVVSKYRFIIHLLDDLFIYQRKYRIRASRVISRQNKSNRLRHAIHTGFFLFYGVLNLFPGAWNQIQLQHSADESNEPIGSQVKAFLMKKAAG